MAATPQALQTLYVVLVITVLLKYMHVLIEKILISYESVIAFMLSQPHLAIL